MKSTVIGLVLYVLILVAGGYLVAKLGYIPGIIIAGILWFSIPALWKAFVKHIKEGDY